MLNKSNIKKQNEYISTINICDCLLEDIKEGIIQKTFEFSLNYLYTFNYITFDNTKDLIKSFYTKNYYLLFVLIESLRYKTVKNLKELLLSNTQQ